MKVTQKTEIIDKTSFCAAAREQLTSTAKNFSQNSIIENLFVKIF
jgi:hypothetical protein